jgi:hypothetical protein
MSDPIDTNPSPDENNLPFENPFSVDNIYTRNISKKADNIFSYVYAVLFGLFVGFFSIFFLCLLSRRRFSSNSSRDTHRCICCFRNTLFSVETEIQKSDELVCIYFSCSPARDTSISSTFHMDIRAYCCLKYSLLTFTHSEYTSPIQANK